MNKEKEAIAKTKYENLLPNMSDYIEFYAKKKKKAIAITEFNTGE
jgi:hypothetical protein